MFKYARKNLILQRLMEYFWFKIFLNKFVQKIQEIISSEFCPEISFIWIVIYFSF